MADVTLPVTIQIANYVTAMVIGLGYIFGSIIAATIAFWLVHKGLKYLRSISPAEIERQARWKAISNANATTQADLDRIDADYRRHAATMSRRELRKAERERILG